MFNIRPLTSRFAAICIGVAVSAAASADWSLVNDQSQLNFVSVKNDSVGEVHRFADLAGTITDDGVYSLTVDLSSVKTQIEIRDQRMQEHLFEIKTFPIAIISGKLDPVWLHKLAKARPTSMDTELTISLHGKTVKKMASLNVIKLDRKRIYVTSLSPVIINAADFGLEKGVATLKQLAGLPSIALSVPVTIDLMFKK